MGRLIALSIVVASVFLQNLSVLAQWADIFGLTLLLCALLTSSKGVLRFSVIEKNQYAKRAICIVTRILILLLVFIISVAWSTWRAEKRIADRLSTSLENVVSRVPFQVIGLVQDQGDSFRFEAAVLANDQTGTRLAGIPQHIQVVWRKPSQDRMTHTIRPGQIWRAALIFRSPRGALNPHGFDYEAHLLSRNIRAIGRVRGNPEFISENPFASMSVMVSGVRQYLRTAMRKHIGQMSYGAVLIALAIGDQDSVKPEHWEIFNKTGITHLVSISGSHVTMLAAFGGLSMLWFWKRLRWRGRAVAECVPAKVIASISALCVAWLYCLLAGWGVPARRTFFMLLVSGIAMLTRLPISVSSVLCLAAAVVTVIDPWSPVTTGFWLSFGAVGVLFYVGSHTQNTRDDLVSSSRRFWHMLKESAKLQWIITLAMLPALAFLFQQVSVSSPLANAIAIPVITFIVTPLSLLMALISLVPTFDALAGWTAWLAHFALDLTMQPVSWLAFASWSSFTIAAMPFWCLLLSIAGIAWALQPPGIPVRWVGWSLLLPALTWQPQKLPLGGWQLIALDVGQGSAVLVRTHRHVLLFDVGPRLGVSDAGQRVVSPVLRAYGMRRLDALVVSHPDIDHAGGVPGLLQEIPVELAYASFDLVRWLDRNHHALLPVNSIPRPLKSLNCAAEHTWTWDEVKFSFLHPEVAPEAKQNLQTNDQGRKKNRSNANSCVLLIQGKFHSALLPGDISTKQEGEILQRASTLYTNRAGYVENGWKKPQIDLRADVVVVAHHGSTTSSSSEFVAQMDARHAIAQAGFFNRFSHPAPEIIARWQARAATFWRTDNDGAVTADSDEKGLHVYAQAQLRKRYWHQRD